MADFVDDFTDVPETKVDLTAVPASASTTKYIRATDVNTLSSAASSLRTAILAGKKHGLRDVTSDPTGVAATSQTFSVGGALRATQGSHSGERVIQRASFEKYAPNAAGTGDNTALMNTATAAVTALGGGELFIPNGTYRFTSNWSVPEGVTLVGESRAGCILLIDHADATTDGITFPSNGSSYRLNGGLQNLTVKANVSQAACRDCVSINLWAGVKLRNVKVMNAGRYGIYMGAVLDVALEDVTAEHCKTDGLYVDTQSAIISTTVRADRCYFRDTTDGAGADVACNGIVFSKCIFESNGSTTRSAGVGARVRSGQVFFNGCYWENNAVWDVDAGTDSAAKAQVVINGFTLTSGGYKQAGFGGFRFDYCDSGLVLGGTIPAMDKSIVFRSHCSGVNTSGIQYTTTEPEWEGSGGITKYPGIVQGQDGTTGQWKLEGNYAVRIGSGPQVSQERKGTVALTSHSLAAGAAESFTVTMDVTVIAGDLVCAVGFSVNMPDLVIASAMITANNTCKLTFHNVGGGAATIPTCTATVTTRRQS